MANLSSRSGAWVLKNTFPKQVLCFLLPLLLCGCYTFSYPGENQYYKVTPDQRLELISQQSRLSKDFVVQLECKLWNDSDGIWEEDESNACQDLARLFMGSGISVLSSEVNIPIEELEDESDAQQEDEDSTLHKGKFYSLDGQQSKNIAADYKLSYLEKDHTIGTDNLQWLAFFASFGLFPIAYEKYHSAKIIISKDSFPLFSETFDTLSRRRIGWLSFYMMFKDMLVTRNKRITAEVKEQFEERLQDLAYSLVVNWNSPKASLLAKGKSELTGEADSVVPANVGSDEKAIEKIDDRETPN